MTRILQSPASHGNDAPARWALIDGELAPLDGAAAMLLVPTEQVTILAVDLPVAGARARAQALPFAIEGRIAAPVESVHLAIGAEVAPRRYLVGVVDHAVMAGWRAKAGAAGLAGVAIVPDALVLPVPPEGSWTVARTAERVTARRPDGTGLAVPGALLDLAWGGAGRPALIEWDGVEAPPALDLAQGPYAWPVRERPWRRFALIAGCALAAHGVIAVADTLALQRIADRWRGEAQAALAAVQPGATGDPALAAEALLPAGGGGGAPSAFLPDLGRAAAQLGPAAQIARIDYGPGGLTVTQAGPARHSRTIAPGVTIR